MRLVLDTNVIFAAFASRGLTHSVFELCIEKHIVIISEHILGELQRIFSKKLKLSQSNIDLIFKYLKEICILEDTIDVADTECRDKDDSKILGLAKNTKPDLIISGDKDLLVLKKFQEIPIISPREFWELQRIKKYDKI